MAYFGDKRIGLMGTDKTVPPEETLDGQPYRYSRNRASTNTTYGLGDGYFAVSGSLPRTFDVQAAVDELITKVQRSANKKVSNVTEVSSKES